MSLVRLQKVISDAGYSSRRKAEELIGLEKVKVDGIVVTKLGTKIDPTENEVEIEGEKLKIGQPNFHFYIILNKPLGYITSNTSRQGKAILDLLIPKNFVGKDTALLEKIKNLHLHPVGRLDKDSEGLVLLTNDGELTNKLTHPRYQHEKEYEVTINGRLTDAHKQLLERPMKLGKEKVRGIKVMGIKSLGKTRLVTVILNEGKNRQIRHMFGALGHRVINLKRTRVGKLNLGGLAVGKYKFIEKDEIV